MSALLPFPPPGSHPVREFDLSDLVHEVCESLESVCCARGVNIEADAPPYMMVRADRLRLRQALEHLLTIILAVSPARSDLLLTTVRDEGGVELEVAGGHSIFLENAGCNDPLEIAPFVDSPWQEIWSEIRRIIAADGAEISTDACPEGGIACTIYFPHGRGEDADSRKAA